MANRTTQVAREVLEQGSNPNARVTQAAREVLVGTSTLTAVRVTQVAIETLVFIGTGPPAAEVRETQAVLEHADSQSIDLRETQAGLEWVGTNPPASNVNETQAALEHIDFPPNDTRTTAVCLEVVLQGTFTSLRKNYAYIGTMART